jgi:hypothetical protein
LGGFSSVDSSTDKNFLKSFVALASKANPVKPTVPPVAIDDDPNEPIPPITSVATNPEPTVSFTTLLKGFGRLS